MLAASLWSANERKRVVECPFDCVFDGFVEEVGEEGYGN